MTRHDWTVLALIGTSGLCSLALTPRLVHRIGTSQDIQIVHIQMEGAGPEAVPQPLYEFEWEASWVPYRRWEPVRGRTVVFPKEFSLGLKDGEAPIRFSGPGGRVMGLSREPSLLKRPTLRFQPIR